MTPPGSREWDHLPCPPESAAWKEDRCRARTTHSFSPTHAPLSFESVRIQYVAQREWPRAWAVRARDTRVHAAQHNKK